MNNTKHTAGEWLSKDGQIYSFKTGKTLALIPYYATKFYTPEHEEQEANAKLIAAAPELLENLKLIIDRIEENNLQGDFPSAYKRAKEAINKTN